MKTQKVRHSLFSKDPLKHRERDSERAIAALVHPLSVIEEQDHARRALKPSDDRSSGAPGQPHNVVDREHGFERGNLARRFDFGGHPVLSCA